MMEFAVVFFILVAVVGVFVGFMADKRYWALRKLHDARGARLMLVTRKLEIAGKNAIPNLREARAQRDASQRSVDSLSAELKKVRAQRSNLMKRVQRMQELQHKLGNGLETLYTDLKLREEDD